MTKTQKLQPNTVRIRFGPTCDPFAVQAKKQGLRYDKQSMKYLQSYYKAMLILRFAGLLGDAPFKKMEARLFKRILGHLQKQNKNPIIHAHFFTAGALRPYRQPDVSDSLYNRDSQSPWV
jgi:hypothetical protein